MSINLFTTWGKIIIYVPTKFMHLLTNFLANIGTWHASEDEIIVADIDEDDEKEDAISSNRSSPEILSSTTTPPIPDNSQPVTKYAHCSLYVTKKMFSPYVFMAFPDT